MTEGPQSRSVSGGDGREPVTAADVAGEVGGRLIGDGSIALHGIAALDRATARDLSFLSHARYAQWYANTRAGVVLVSPAFAELPTTAAARIVVEKPTDAMLLLLARFHRGEVRPVGVHATAVVDPSASLGAGVTVEPFVVIGPGVVLGDGCWIGSGATIGEDSVLGRDVRVFPRATVYPRVELGDRVVLHAGAQVGREGFGFVPREREVVRIPHVGRCVLEHDVEIGANSCVDRGSVDDTIIGAGTKVDNLVHVAHNVRIGRMCFLAAQVGIAGSTRIEDGVQIGGQAGIGGHLTVGARASIGGQGGVIGDVPAGETWSGYPARPHKEQLRTAAAATRLARLVRPIEQLLRREAVE